MLVSSERRFIFVHVPKTAGRSIKAALKPHAPDARWRMQYDVTLPFYPKRWDSRHHLARHIKPIVGEQMWQQCFGFTFVRNPWARLVSWYNFRREKIDYFGHPDIPDLEAFLALPADTYFGALPQWHLKYNQLDYFTSEDGEYLVDFVGRFENLYADFNYICQRIGVETQLTNEHPYINKTQKVDYREYYTAALRDRVGEMFARDIAEFGYEFDPAPIPRSPRRGEAELRP